MSSGEESNKEEELAIVNLENVKRISETYQPRKGKGKNKKGSIPKSVVQEIWKDRLSPRFYSRLMSVMFPEESNEVSFLSFYTIYKNLAEPETEIMFRALTIYHIATIHEPPFNYETANEYPNASYKAIKDYVCDVIMSYLHAIINFNMKEAHAWLSLKASNTLIDGNLATSYVLKDLETHRNEVSIGSLEIWLEKNEIYYTVSEQLYLFLFGVKSSANVKPLLPLPVVQTNKVNKTLLALPDVLLLNSKLRKRAQRWTLAYILDRHSQNWETFKQAIYGKGQTIIVIQDGNGDIFGMYGSQRWVPTDGFFGNDECFLFTLKPDVNIYEGSGRDNNFQLFNESGIGMGGMEDRPGLFIQSDTVKGKTSLACRTFREFWPLSRELEFKISQMEIWTVDGDETKTEENVQDLIGNTQYMKMRGDEVYDETKSANQPDVKQQLTIQDTIAHNSPGMQEVTKCCGKCAMDTLMSQPESDPRSPKYKQQRVCCSKRCPKKIRVSSRDLNGEGDGNTRVHVADRFPRQEENKHQRHHRYSVEEVKVKRENDRKFRTSFDAQQKHGADGFVHPSLAAEENARNARKAAEAAKKNAKNGAEESQTNARDAAEAAKKSVKDGAEENQRNAKDAAEAAKKSTKNARDAAEPAKKSAKNARDAAEAAKKSANDGAEENQRNSKDAAEAAKKSAKDGAEENDSNTQTIKNSNKTESSKKRRLSYDGESSQKSYSPNSSLHKQTICNTQAQVGESRLMKPTCRTYRHSINCASVVKTTCACPPKFVSPSGNDKMVASSRARFSVTSNNSKQSNNSNRPTPKVQTHQLAMDDQKQKTNGKSAPTTHFPIESSSSVLIETKKSNMEIKDNNVASLNTETNAHPNKPKSPTKNEKEPKKLDREATVKIRISPIGKSEAPSKHAKMGKSRPEKEKQNDTLYSTSSSYATLNEVDEIAKAQIPSQDLMLPELDCHCSSESYSEFEVVKKSNPAFECCCQTKVSNYLTKNNKTDITDVSLSAISSSVCSCILDNKKITIASSELSASSFVRETQNLCKSMRKSDGSTHSEITANDVTKSNAKNLRKGSPIRISSEKETQLHLKSRGVSRTSADPSVPLIETPIPPTCLSCKTLVGQHGCECKLKYKGTKISAKETQNLTTSRRLSEWSSASGTVSSPAIKVHQTSMGKESPKYNRSVIKGASSQGLKPVTDSGSPFGSTSSKNDERSSQSLSSQSKPAPKRTCGASCKCSLSPAYFPVFPEDFIKEGAEECDCASYNNLQFPVIVETPPYVSEEPSTTRSLSPTAEPETVQEPPVEELQLKKCGCDDSDNTIIILNVSKCETAETVEKLIHDLEEKAGDPKIKSLLIKCKDFKETKPMPCSTKNEADREALRQQIEKILQKKSPPVQPGQEEHPN